MEGDASGQQGGRKRGEHPARTPGAPWRMHGHLVLGPHLEGMYGRAQGDGGARFGQSIGDRASSSNNAALGRPGRGDAGTHHLAALLEPRQAVLMREVGRQPQFAQHAVDRRFVVPDPAGSKVDGMAAHDGAERASAQSVSRLQHHHVTARAVQPLRGPAIRRPPRQSPPCRCGSRAVLQALLTVEVSRGDP